MAVISDDTAEKMGIGHKIELFEYSTFDKEDELDSCIISVKSLDYAVRNLESYQAFQRRFYNINKNIRNGITDCDEEFDLVLLNSPVTHCDMIVYRGIPSAMNLKEGDILNCGYIFASINRGYAMRYVKYDTRSLYDENGILASNAWLKEHINHNTGTLFRISVPKGIHYFTFSSYDHGYNELINEIIFEKYKRIIVNSISKIQVSNLILVDAILV